MKDHSEIIEEMCKENTISQTGSPKNKRMVDLIEWASSAWYDLKEKNEEYQMLLGIGLACNLITAIALLYHCLTHP
jgi:hypothetical protein